MGKPIKPPTARTLIKATTLLLSLNTFICAIVLLIVVTTPLFAIYITTRNANDTTNVTRETQLLYQPPENLTPGGIPKPPQV